MKITRAKLFCMTALTPLLMLPANGAHAQSTGGQPEAALLEEVVVTSRKREERLIDIPETIAAISAEQLAARGITTLDDLGRQTPNISLNRRQDNEPNVVIR